MSMTMAQPSRIRKSGPAIRGNLDSCALDEHDIILPIVGQRPGNTRSANQSSRRPREKRTTLYDQSPTSYDHRRPVVTG
jgi:hypothetical protein